MKISVTTTLIICVLAFFACKEPDPKGKLVQVGNLTFLAPIDYKLDTVKGIDSYVTYLITPTNDTFHIEYGKAGIIYRLFQPLPHVFPIEELEKLSKATGKVPKQDEALFSESPAEDEAQAIFDKNYYLYDTINSIVVKMVQPKKIGQGVTGIVVSKLKNGFAFSIYANNLDSTAHIKAIRMFRTLKYK